MIGFTHNNKSYNIKGVKVGVRGEAQLQLIGNVCFFVRKKSPCHPVWGARGFQATMASFIQYFQKGKVSR